jgi:hypothetical protein
MKSDAISIVEAAYDCEGKSRAWFHRLLEVTGPKLDRGLGVLVARYTPTMRPEETWVDTHKMKRGLVEALNAMGTAYPAIFHRALSAVRTHDTASRSMGLTAKQAQSWTPYVDYLHPLGVREIIGVIARDPGGHAIFLSAPAPDTRRPTPQASSSWSRIAAHISAGSRLRRALESLPLGDLAAGADAILSPSGSITHAEVDAQSPSARESLRRAAKAIDRARSKARSSEDEALDLWQGLVAGMLKTTTSSPPRVTREARRPNGGGAEGNDLELGRCRTQKTVTQSRQSATRSRVTL